MKILIIGFSFIVIVTAPFFGQIPLALTDILKEDSIAHKVFFELRLPRVFLAFLVGGILALGGLIFQTVFRNPMSTPFTLGVASGATLFTAIAILLGLSSFSPLFAFIGAMSTVIILFSVASRFSTYDSSSLLLVGIALSFFYSASLMVMFYLSNLQESYEIMRFTMGSLDIVGFDSIYILLITASLLLLVIHNYRYEIKLLLTSYEFAYLKGIDVKKTNYILLLSVSIAVGVAVSFTGPIGFVGLIIPHILKTLYKQSADTLVFPIFFYGGVFLVLSDLLARNISSNTDIPIGVLTSFLGAPFFIYLLLKRKTS
ncbi:Vitamin B12 ABC transporter, permease component BtuC [hydrothermal vent metagenome]|uniref:Vitamin B12 ABC transporter, permease component BtuC n=1 Tax=hydrothermal vent metagenome TaxID=652676 RepID=A0A1W1D0X8_9ZZZZ